MLGDPEAAISPALGVLREIERVPQGGCRIPPFDNRREVEDRKLHVFYNA
jgi:hypothetical protein